MNIYKKQYYLKNRDKVLQKMKLYYENNRDRILKKYVDKPPYHCEFCNKIIKNSFNNLNKHFKTRKHIKHSS